jgi:hypothetical protein
MSGPIDAFLVLIGLVFSVSCCAAGAVAAIAMTCRWLEWAPVNTTIYIHNHYPEDPQ